MKIRCHTLSNPVAGRRRAGNKPRRGISLMEVMLALAILGVSMAALGELVRLGVRSASEARDLSTAQLLCESKMAEISSGVELAEPATRAPVDLFPEWLYSVDVIQVDQQGLLDVQITVEQDIADGRRPVFFTLHRWMIDPEFELSLKAAAEEEAAAAELELTAVGGDNG